MKGLVKTAAAIAFLAAPGCIVIPKPKPFVQSVAAEPLRTIDAEPAVSVRAAEAEAPAELEPTTAAEPAAEASPARTDIKGAGDGSMRTDVITITAKDIPRRAPNYSPEQTASMVCLADKMGFNNDSARKAHAATIAAKEARERLGRNEITLKQSDEFELKRQAAVRAYRAPPIPLIGLVFGYEKKDGLPKPRYNDVVIENPDLFTFKENGKDVMAVSGAVRNTGSERAELPPVTLEALDEWDFVLAGQTSLLPFEHLDPGEARAFEMRFHNPPEYTGEVYVHFVPPFSYRNRRDCQFFDPAVFNADTAPETLVAATAAASKDGAYTAAELNFLTQYYRRESASVWRCREAEKKGCQWSTHALHWRDMFAMSEAIDEAWIALRAAEETQGRFAKNEATQADVDKANAARDVAIDRFTAIGDRALARAGGSVRDVGVTLTSSNYGRDEQGLYVEFTGTMTNSGATPRKVDALMVAFVNRLDLPLSSIAVDFPRELAPGETASFSKRIEARQAQGFTTFELISGGGEEAPTVARVPPRDIPWEVRVGAMAK